MGTQTGQERSQAKNREDSIGQNKRQRAWGTGSLMPHPSTSFSQASILSQSPFFLQVLGLLQPLRPFFQAQQRFHSVARDVSAVIFHYQEASPVPRVNLPGKVGEPGTQLQGKKTPPLPIPASLSSGSLPCILCWQTAVPTEWRSIYKGSYFLGI